MFRVYIACLASYNSGIMHGEWVEVTGNVHALKEEIARILKASPEEDAEEWAVHGHEGFGSYKVTEWPDLAELCDHVAAYEESSHDSDLIDGVIADRNCTAREAIEIIDDNYQGEYDDLECWAEQFLADTGDINLPKHLQYYFDYAKYARDCELEGSIMTIPSGRKVYVLWNN